MASNEAIEEYRSSLADLTCNSKPLINMLTMLAEDHEDCANEIVHVIETHIAKAKPTVKLSVLYLIDSIIKNLPNSNYIPAFTNNITQIFCGAFEKVDEKTRQAMFKLRQTWSDIFPSRKLYMIDVRVNQMDPAWPITAASAGPGSIHINPKFIKQTSEEPDEIEVDQEAEMRQQLIAKQQELLKLQQERLELELAETRAKLESQKRAVKISMMSPTEESDTPPIDLSAELPILKETLPPIQSVESLVPTASKSMRSRDPRLARDPRVTSRDPRKAAQPSQPVQPITQPVQPITQSVQPFTHPVQPHTHPVQIVAPSVQPTDIVNSSVLEPAFSKPSVMHSASVFHNEKEVDSATDSTKNTSPVHRAGPKSMDIDDKSNTSKQDADHPKMKIPHLPEVKQNDKKSARGSPVKTDKLKDGHKSSSKRVSPKDKSRPSSSRSSEKLQSKPVQDNTRTDRRSRSSSTDSSTSSKRDDKRRDPVDRRERSYRKRRSGESSGDDEDHNKLQPEKRGKLDVPSTISRSSRSPDKSKFDRHRRTGSSKERETTEDYKDRKPAVTCKDAKDALQKTEVKRDQPSQPVRKTDSRSDTRDKKHADERKSKDSKSTPKEASKTGKPSVSKDIKKDGKGESKVTKERESPKGEKISKPKAESRKTFRIPRKRDSEQNEPKVDRKSDISIPESKKARQSAQENSENIEPMDEDISSLFGSEDQDYRQLPPTTPGKGMTRGPPLKSPSSARWAKFKAEHPQEFPFEASEDVDERIPPSPSGDIDMRTPGDPRRLSASNENMDFPPMHAPPMPPPRFIKKPEGRRLSIGPDTAIPKELSIQSRGELLKRAEHLRHIGELTHHQHQEILSAIEDIDDYQREREHVEHRMHEGPKPHFLHREDLSFPPKDVDLRSLSRRSPPRHGRPRDVPMDIDLRPEHHGKDEDLRSGMRPPDSRSVPHPRDLRDSRGPSGAENLDARGRRPRPRDLGSPPHGHRIEDRRLRDAPDSRPDKEPPTRSHFNPRREARREAHRSEPDFPPPEERPPRAMEDGPVPRDPVVLPHEDLRWDMNPGMLGFDDHQEVVIDKSVFSVSLEDRPRKVRVSGTQVELFADGLSRGIRMDGELVYSFGEPVKDLKIGKKLCKFFFHGPSRLFWVDGHPYEVRIDAPPKRMVIGDKPVLVQIDGRDMMLLIDRIEKGPYGGPPRELKIENQRFEIRFDPSPRKILVDGDQCDLCLDKRIPVIMIQGKAHVIAFDGPPRNVTIDGNNYLVPCASPVRVRLGSRSHVLALGGPAHEVIIDGKWFEVRFGGPPREIQLGNRTHMVSLEGQPPEVKILDEVPVGYEPPVTTGKKMRDRPLFSIPQAIVTPAALPIPVPGQPVTELRQPGPDPGPKLPTSMQPDPRELLPGPGQPMPGPIHAGPSLAMPGPGHPLPSQPMPGPGQPMPGQGHPMPGPGQLMPGPGQPMPGPGQLMPGPGQPMPGPGQPMPGPGQPMPGPGQLMPGPGQPMPGPGQPMPGQPMPGPGQPMPGPGQPMPLPGQPMPRPGQPMPRPGQPMPRPGQQIPGPGHPVLDGPRFNGDFRPPGPDGINFQPGMVPINQVSSSQPLDHRFADPRFDGPRFGGMGNFPQPMGVPGSLPRPEFAGPNIGPMIVPVVPAQLPQIPISPSILANVSQSLNILSQMNTGQVLSQPQMSSFPVSSTVIPQQPMNQFILPQPDMPKTSLPSGLSSLFNSGGMSQPSTSGPAPAPLDVNSLFKKLINSGIISKVGQTSESDKPAAEEEEEDSEITEEKIEEIPDISDFKTEKLRKRYNGAIQRIYSGIQCSSCGMRFVIQDTERYREHLDWHFRQNKREKEGIRVAKNRRWFYTVNEWIQYEEIEESEERARSSVFERMQETTVEKPVFNLPAGEVIVRCPPASGNENDVCEICAEPFEQYFDEDEEEWHLRDAVRAGEKTYHPVCYEDATQGSVQDCSPSPTASPVVNPLTVSSQSTTITEAIDTTDTGAVQVKMETDVKSEDPTDTKDVKSEVESESELKSDVTKTETAVESSDIKTDPEPVVVQDNVVKEEKMESS